MTKISITIPSLYPDALGRTMDNIEDVTTGDYEVIVVSPFRFERENVVWVEETERKGCAAAHHIAAKAATGDFLVAFADDHVFVDGWDAVAIENFRRRESVFLQRGGHSSFEPAPFCLGLRHTYPQHVGTEFGITYPYFPLLRRSAVDRVGWIGPDYRSGFGDSDLGMRVWEAGGRVEFSEEGLIVVTSDDGRKPGALCGCHGRASQGGHPEARSGLPHRGRRRPGHRPR